MDTTPQAEYGLTPEDRAIFFTVYSRRREERRALQADRTDARLMADAQSSPDALAFVDMLTDAPVQDVRGHVSGLGAYEDSLNRDD